MKQLLQNARLLVILFLVVGFFSCERFTELYRLSDSGTNTLPGPDGTGNENPCGEPVVIPLVFEDDLETSIGDVIVTNDDANLTVQFKFSERNWKFTGIYLYVGPFDGIPLQINVDPLPPGSYPAYWNFVNQITETSVDSYTFNFPLSGLDECFVVLALAEVTNTQTEAVLWTAGPNPAEWNFGPFYTKYCKEFCKEISDGSKKGVYRTQTPGGWGAKAAGNNPGVYRDANFDGAFPKGLIVGDLGNYSISLTSAKAIEKLLPTGGKPAVLTRSYKDPKKIKNVLVGHLVALTLSVGFDDYDKDFGKADGHLKGLKIADGYGFDGMNIKDILKEANKVLGGGSSSYSPSQMTEILTKINEYFVDGKKSKKYKLFDCK